MTTPDNFEGRIFYGNLRWAAQYASRRLVITTEIVKWDIVPDVTRNALSDDLGVNISCDYKYEASNLWQLDTEIYIVVLFDGKISAKKMDYCFNRCSSKCRLDNIAEINKVYYFANNKPLMLYEGVITATIQVKSWVGIQNIQMSSFTIPNNIDSEICFRIHGFPFYVDKHALLSNSTIFREMLSDGTNEFELKNVYYKHFIVFLRLLCGHQQSILSDYVKGLLKLANDYNVQFLMHDIEEFLISSEKITVTAKLRFAEVYKLSKLQTEILEKTMIVKWRPLYKTRLT